MALGAFSDFGYFCDSGRRGGGRRGLVWILLGGVGWPGDCDVVAVSVVGVCGIG